MAVFNKDKIDYGIIQRNDDQDPYYYARESMQQLESLQHQQQHQHQHINGVFNQSAYSGQSISQLVIQQNRQQLQPQLGISRNQQAINSSAGLGSGDNSLQYINSSTAVSARNHGGLASLNGSIASGIYGGNGIIGNVRSTSNEFNSGAHQYGGVSRIPQSSNSPQFETSTNFPLLSSSTSLSSKGGSLNTLGYNAVAALSSNLAQGQLGHRLLNGNEDDFAIENEDFPALPGSHSISSKNSNSEQQQQQQQQHSANGISASGHSLASTADRHSLQQQQLQHPDLLSQQQSNLFSNAGFGLSSQHHSNSSSSGLSGDLQLNMNGRGSLIQSQGSALLNSSSNLSQDTFGTSLSGSAPQPPPPQPPQPASVTKEGKYGLSGLLEIIRYTDKEFNVLALGTDLTTFGLNLNASDSLYPSFLSPFSETSSSQPEPPFSTPTCYLMHPPSLKTEHLSKFQLETLFYMFYSMPKDILQACAAQELYRREWRYHSELRLWLKPRTAQELMQSHPSVHFIYFEVSGWETRLFTTSTGRGNLAAGLLTEDEVRVKAPQPNSAPSLPLGGGPSVNSAERIDDKPLRESVEVSTILPNSDDISITDSEVANLLQKELKRQRFGIELIASENFVSKAVLQALGSCATNKYSEGQPGARYYGGNKYIDELEILCQNRALKLFGLDPTQWGVNVQPYSGSPANFAVYTALLKPHDRIMGLDLPSGGHLTHGYQTLKRKVSATSIFFESLPYRVNPSSGLIDYSEMAKLAELFKPKLLIAGGSAYPRDWDYKAMREIADSVGAYLMADMAHISGLVATKQCNDPFEHCDVVTSTTHKSLRGPRSGVIFCKRELLEAINSAVFPSLQGGPHNHQIAALAVALKEASKPEFVDYIKQVKLNAAALAASLQRRGYSIVTNGTDNHLLLWDLRPTGLSGAKIEKICEMCEISVNKNSVCGDTSAVSPGGVRLGTPAMTTRGMKEMDMEKIAAFLHRIVGLSSRIQEEVSKGGQKGLLKDFLHVATTNQLFADEIAVIRNEVELYAGSFPLPG